MAVGRRLFVFALAASVSLVAASPPALSITKRQVDAACADSKTARGEYQQAQDRFYQAAVAYEAAANDVEVNELRQANLRASLEHREGSINDLKTQIEERAVQLYMSGGAGASSMVLFADSLDQLVTGNEFLSAATRDDLASIDDLASLRTDMERLRVGLEQAEVELRRLAEARQTWQQQQEEAMVAEQAAYNKLSARCASLLAQYDAEQRRMAARGGRGGAGLSAAATPGFICPMNPSHTSFIDSWGFPRSGGRRHKGTDMFASYGEPVVAVAAGSVSVGNGGLGGKTLWLVADYGVGFYYAHLASFAVTGGRVAKGDVVGYNGDSGNAEGGAPHVHFEIHPGGRGSGAVNPYPTLRGACR